MDRVNQYAFYQFGVSLGELNRLKAGDEYADFIIATWAAGIAIGKFLTDTPNIPLRLSKIAAQKLQDVLLRHADNKKSDDPVLPSEIDAITKALIEFEAVFASEAQDLEVFSVPQKGAYSTTTLINEGENVLPPSIRDFISAYVKEEMHEAGRCLAFTLPTAAGFHMMRSIESVLHNYWDIVSGGKPRPKFANGNDAAMGTFINEVEKEGADAKVVATLRQIKDLHRNPLMHPADVLSESDAIVLLGVVTGGIMAMVDEMKRNGLTSAPSS
jgi:hypothetical protein